MARSSIRTFPLNPRVVPDLTHPILRAQSCWFVANAQNRNVRDILNRGSVPGSLGANVSFGGHPLGNNAWKGDGNANSFLDLGSTNRFIASGTNPLTISWVEWHSGAGANQGIVQLFPTGSSPSTRSFIIFRSSDATATAATYGSLAVGPWETGRSLNTSITPPKLNLNLPLCFVVTLPLGADTNVGGSIAAYWSGAQYGQVLMGLVGNSGALGATQNYFGWDNNELKFSGLLDNLRVWNRLLGDSEIHAVLSDPYVGRIKMMPRRASIAITAPGGFHPWFAMPTGWLS